MAALFVARSKTETPNTTISQSSAMMPLTWHIAILVTGTVAAAAVGAPSWLTILLAGLAAGTVVLAWTTYLRLLRTDREALRSHEGHIPRIVTEQAGLAGLQEGRTGIAGTNEVTKSQVLPRPPTSEGGAA